MSASTTSDPAAARGSLVRRVTAAWRPPVWREVLFGLVGLPLAVAGVVYVAVALYIGGLATLTIVGLPLVALALRGARGLGDLHRWLVAALLGESIPTPPRATGSAGAAGGLLGWVRAGLTDGTAWRSVLYLLVRLPVAVLTLVGAVATWGYGVFALLLPFLSRPVFDEDPTVSLAVQSVVVGGALLWLAPWASARTADLNRWLARSLLGRTPASPRQQALERARSDVAADAAATLRRIERDLHDGTQARLVAIGLSLALADEALAEGDVERARPLVGRARHQVGEATTELRRLTRGINPVALDGGLAEALPTLAADTGIPTDLVVDLTERPSPAIERVVYFCVAELLSNAAKHSGADSARVEVTTVPGADGRRLRLRVRDEGRGGAVVGAGSGLRGLRDRLAAVDGTLAVTSPVGGPTVVTAELPVYL
ncbi:MAG TPA: sensor domain-containing protein [Acidimicrobiales bacterium]